VIAQPHLLVAEKLMMVELVLPVDRTQAFDIDRPMHDKAVNRPFEDIGEQEVSGTVSHSSVLIACKRATYT